MNRMEQLSAFRNDVDASFKTVRNFINLMIDDLSFVETDAFLSGKSFLDEKTVICEGVLTGFATVDCAPVYFIAQNSSLMGGSLGKAGAEKICKCIDKALRAGAPIVSIIDSNGARLGEGAGVMEAYASIISAASQVAGRVPHICIVKGNAVGLQSAYCALADFVIAMPDSAYCVGSPMMISAKARHSGKVSELIGAKAMLSAGNVHFAPESDAECAGIVRKLLSYVPADNGSAIIATEDDFNRQIGVSADSTVDELLSSICDESDYLIVGEKTGDVVCALGRLGEKVVGFLATKGELSSKGIRKATRFINYLDSFGIALITFVNSGVVSSDKENELSGAVYALSDLFYAITTSDSAKIAVIMGDAIGASYTAFASKSAGFDYVFALPDAVVSPVTPELAVDIFYSDEMAKSTKDPVSDREKIAKRYADGANVFESAKEGYIDNIVEPAMLRPHVISVLQML